MRVKSNLRGGDKMRDTDFKIRLSEDLKEDFRSVCDQLDYSMSQRVRQLMKSHVDEMKGQGFETTQKKQEWNEKWYRRMRV